MVARTIALISRDYPRTNVQIAEIITITIRQLHDCNSLFKLFESELLEFNLQIGVIVGKILFSYVSLSVNSVEQTKLNCE